MSDKIFAEGIYFKEKHVKAPSFVIGEVSFKIPEAVEFLKKYTNDKGYVNLTLKVGKSGKKYLELNTYGLNKDEHSITPEQVKQIEALKDKHDSESQSFDELSEDVSNVPF
jgi:hypothetical protein